MISFSSSLMEFVVALLFAGAYGGGAPESPQACMLQKGVSQKRAIQTNDLCAQIWNGTAGLFADGNHQCDTVQLSDHWAWGGGAPPKMCLRSYPDFVSTTVRRKSRWPNCAPLSFLWTKLADASWAESSTSFAPCGGSGSQKLFVDVGANIGACTFQMLARPDVAMVAAFEPNPRNLFYLTSSALNNTNYDATNRLALFPIALGETEGSHEMYMSKGNAGNTVLDKPIATDTKLRVITQSTTLDKVFLQGDRKPYIHLMKIDAQGFEVNILKGGRQLLESGSINAILFEVAPDFLYHQGTSPMEVLNILLTNGYDIYRGNQAIAQNAALPARLSREELHNLACVKGSIPQPIDFWAIFKPVEDGSHEALLCD